MERLPKAFVAGRLFGKRFNRRFSPIFVQEISIGPFLSVLTICEESR